MKKTGFKDCFQRFNSYRYSAALRGELWQLFAGVQYRRRPALYQRLVRAAGEPLPPELVAELEQEEAREREEAEAGAGGGAEAETAAGAEAETEAGVEAEEEAEAGRAETERAAEVDTSTTSGGTVEAGAGTASGAGGEGAAAETAEGTTATSSSASEMLTPRAAADGGDMFTPGAPTTDGGGEHVDFSTPPSTLPALHTPFTADTAAAPGAGSGDGGAGKKEAIEPSTPSPASHAAAAAVSAKRNEIEDETESKDGTPSSLGRRKRRERDVLPEIEEKAFAKIKDQIEKDLPRTFPAHPLLDGIGRDALKRVLFAYARHNPSVGYCQGMNFLTALLLLLMEEEAAFWCLAAIVEDILPGYFTNTMLASAVDQAVLQALVEERFPRIAAALETSGAPLAAVSASWFLTLYVNQLPWECALRVWDVLLFERTRAVLFQTALALVDLNAQKLLAAAAEDKLMECVVTLAPGAFDGSGLLAVATSGFADVTWWGCTAAEFS